MTCHEPSSLSGAPETLAAGRFVRLLRQGRWEYVDRVGTSGAVVIVAVTDDERLVLIEQYRVPLGSRVIELPAGLVGDDPGSEGEPLRAAAERELLEETGFVADQWWEAASGPPSAGLATEIVTFFVARGLRPAPRPRVAGEEIEVHLVPLGAIDAWLAEARHAGSAVDPKFLAGLYLLRSHPWVENREGTAPPPAWSWV